MHTPCTPFAYPMHTLCTPHAHPLHAPCTPFARLMQTLCTPHAHPFARPITTLCTPHYTLFAPNAHPLHAQCTYYTLKFEPHFSNIYLLLFYKPIIVLKLCNKNQCLISYMSILFTSANYLRIMYLFKCMQLAKVSQLFPVRPFSWLF